jgi:hypothetical protein
MSRALWKKVEKEANFGNGGSGSQRPSPIGDDQFEGMLI